LNDCQEILHRLIADGDTVVGGQHSFADAVNAYIEKKLTED